LRLYCTFIFQISSDSEEENLTFKALLYQIEATASYLSKNGFESGNVACFVMSNSTAFAVSHLGVLKCGGIITSANPSISQADLEHQLQDSKASLVFTEESILPRVLMAANNCASVKKIICTRSWASNAALPEGVVDFKSLITGPVYEGESHSSDLAVVPYTDIPTRGTATGIMLTHENVSTAVDIYQKYLDRIAKKVLRYWDCSQENLLLCSSFANMYGLLCLNVALIMGFTSVILKKFDPLMFFNSVHSYRVRVQVLLKSAFYDSNVIVGSKTEVRAALPRREE
ncbi:hypothetical protein COOONC_17933, partial [Cooperia oncophora]